MSRTGKKPVAIPAGVTASLDGAVIEVKGPKGTRSFTAGDDVTLTIEGGPSVEAPVFIVADDTRFGLVSDIDDTVVETGVANTVLMLWRLFVADAKSRTAFPGVAAGSIFTFSLTLGDYIIPKLVGPSGEYIGSMVYTLQGTIGDIAVDDVLRLLESRRQTGVLLVNPSNPLRLVLADGAIVLGVSSSTMAIGRFLLACGMVTAEQLEELLGLVRSRLGERQTRRAGPGNYDVGIDVFVLHIKSLWDYLDLTGRKENGKS